MCKVSSYTGQATSAPINPANKIVPKNQAKARMASRTRLMIPTEHRGKDSRCRSDRGLDVGRRMRRRQESRLEGRRRQVDAFLQHTVKEVLEALNIAGHDFVVAIDVTFCREEKSEHAANVIRGELDAGRRRRLA